MARILLGVTGSIAAYKSLALVRLLTERGHSVRALLSEGGAQFIGAASLEALTGAPVLSGVFDDDPWGGAYPGDPSGEAHRPIGHLALAERADLFVIAPASANTIAKLAAGAADDVLTASALIAGRLLVAPAMNNRMWAHAATVANVATLQERGVVIAEPGTGRLASKGEAGTGRLAEPEQLAELIEQLLAGAAAPAADLAGRRILISAGGTREALDAVRFIGNRSSGRMGFALAEAAAARGAEVTLVAANVALATPAGVKRIDLESAAELQAVCVAEFASADVLIAAAAVADFRPAQVAEGKMKKQAGEETRSLELERTPDILAGLAEIKRPDQLVVGFAAEHGAGALDYGRDKLQRKSLDAIVVNDVSGEGIGFDSGENEVVIVTASSETPVARAPKRQIADAILDVVAVLPTA